MVDGVLIYDSLKKSNYNEQSYGLAQWNLDSGNHNFDGQPITKQEAQNAQYSLDLMADYFAKGHANLWSCYRHR